jgi:hypothetical protein
MVNLLAVILLGGLLQVGQAEQASKELQNPPDIETQKFSWSKEIIGWEKDTLKKPIETYQDVQRRERQSARPGPQKTVNADETIKSHQKEPPRVAYSYKLTLKNTGAKAVKSVDWDYVFLDSENNVIGHQQFTSEDKIAPGKSKQLIVITPTPPVRVVSASESKFKSAIAKEMAFVVRIEYQDGTVWQRQ